VDLERCHIWIVIAAYNEGAVIYDVVREITTAGWQVVVVDDGSSDRTAAQARSAGATVLRHAVNLGQGAALQTGIDFAIRRGARDVVTFDADGQHSVADIGPMVDALQGADIALGSRFLGRVEGASRRRVLLLWAAVVLSNRLSRLKLSDTHCGLRAFRAAAAPRLRLTQNRMAHASELLHKVKASCLRVVEVPVTVRYTEHSMTKGQSGFQVIRILFDYFFRTS
jgi:glycosyltransferase involved in cell wall biosynthesis